MPVLRGCADASPHIFDSWGTAAENSFWQHGWCAVKNVYIDETKLGRLHDAAWAAGQESALDPSANRAGGNGRFSIMPRYAVQHRAFLEAMTDTKIVSMINTLGSYIPAKAGGDGSRPGCHEDQDLHSDFGASYVNPKQLRRAQARGYVSPLPIHGWQPPVIAVSIAVQPANLLHAPIRMSTWSMAGSENYYFPTIQDEPSHLAARCLLEPGDILIRDVRCAHAGCANLTQHMRVMTGFLAINHRYFHCETPFRPSCRFPRCLWCKVMHLQKCKNDRHWNLDYMCNFMKGWFQQPDESGFLHVLEIIHSNCAELSGLTEFMPWNEVNELRLLCKATRHWLS